MIAYDPYVPGGRAAQIGVRLVALEELLREADFITVHLPKTPETVGLIGDRQLALVQAAARARQRGPRRHRRRGGARTRRSRTGRVGGAGLDVFATEPCTDSPLFELDNVVATPHLGASTDEAQDKAGHRRRPLGAARAAGRVRAGRGQRAGRRGRRGRPPGLPLVEKLGRIFTALAGEVAQQVDVEVRGEIAEHDVKVLELAALKGVFADVVEDQVTYVNAPLLAAERGVEVRLVTTRTAPTTAT